MIQEKAMVFMIPTDKATALWLDKDDNKLHSYHKPQQGGGKYPEVINQHLHFTSNEEIKEGDYITNGKELDIAETVEDLLVNGRLKINWKKVIATNNPELWNIVPKIELDFIEAYIKDYNEGNPITEVNLEYERFCHKVTCTDTLCNTCCKEIRYRLKLRSNESVIVKPVKPNPFDRLIVLAEQMYKEQEANKDHWLHENHLVLQGMDRIIQLIKRQSNG